MRREGIMVAKCTVERLMRAMGLAGVRRGKKTITTISNPKAPCPLDKVNRAFRVRRPNALWVVDFTYVHTWADRKSVVKGKSVSARVDLGGGRIIKTQEDTYTNITILHDIITHINTLYRAFYCK